MAEREKFFGNHRETAQLLGISEQALWKAVKERGCPVRGRAGKETLYDWREVLVWRISDLMPDDLDLNRERARLAKAQADRTEQDLAVRRGELIPVGAVLQQWSDVLAAVRAKLLSMPSKLGPQLVSISDAGIIAAAIKAVVYEALGELMAWEPAGTDPSGDAEPEAAAGPDGGRVVRRGAKAKQRVERGAGAVAD